LHAHLFPLPEDHIRTRVEEMLDRFDLRAVAETRPDSLPLGIRQRLQLAVAVIHGPKILILDEPTSGVDPINRDSFWELLLDLSRREGVTIFITTHFMNEAMRCDRISLMNAGKVLAQAPPAAIIRNKNAPALEDAFIAYLEEATRGDHVADAAVHEAPTAAAAGPDSRRPRRRSRFSPRRLWAYARREA